MVLDAVLLNTQHHKVTIKGKVELSREWNSTLPYTSVWKLLKREPSSHPRLRSPTLLTYLIDLHWNILVFCTIPCSSPFLPTHIFFCTTFALIYYIHLYDWCFNFCLSWRSPCGIVPNVMDCDIIVSEFELHSHCSITDGRCRQSVKVSWD